MSTDRRYEHFINGEWVPPSSGAYFDSTNPATLDVLYQAARGNAADVEKAVSAASAAFENPSWRNLSQTKRGHLLRRLGDLPGGLRGDPRGDRPRGRVPGDAAGVGGRQVGAGGAVTRAVSAGHDRRAGAADLRLTRPA